MATTEIHYLAANDSRLSQLFTNSDTLTLSVVCVIRTEMSAIHSQSENRKHTADYNYNFFVDSHSFQPKIPSKCRAIDCLRS